jgi:hypothetical protein
VLALEPDPAKASSIERAVSNCTRAGLTLVRSKDQLLNALRDGLPDLLLLPSLLPPSDESAVFEYLRASTEKRHLEVLVTPYEIVPDGGEDVEPTGSWRRVLWKAPARPKLQGCDFQSFAERLEWALRCAQEARRDRAEHFKLFKGTTVGSLEDRRVHRRFPLHELPWLQQARIQGSSKVKLLDLSTGGVLVQSDVRMHRDSEGLLQLVGATRDSFVPFRVVRWQPLAGRAALRYLGACAFSGDFEFDSVLGPCSVDPEVTPGANASSALAPFFRHPDNHQERDPRLTRRDVPWLSNIKLPWGPEVDLVNISKSGMLVETTSKFAPGSAAEFHLHGTETTLAVPARVVRSEVAEVGKLGVKYQAAVAFTQEMRFPGQLGGGRSTPKVLANLLTDVLGDISHLSEGAGVLRKRFLDGLRKLVRAREIAITSEPARSESGAESIYFTIPTTRGRHAFLQATFEPDHAPNEVEFRCLQSAAALAGVVLEFEQLT